MFFAVYRLDFEIDVCFKFQTAERLKSSTFGSEATSEGLVTWHKEDLASFMCRSHLDNF